MYADTTFLLVCWCSSNNLSRMSKEFLRITVMVMDNSLDVYWSFFNTSFLQLVMLPQKYFYDPTINISKGTRKNIRYTCKSQPDPTENNFESPVVGKNNNFERDIWKRNFSWRCERFIITLKEKIWKLLFTKNGRMQWWMKFKFKI